MAQKSKTQKAKASIARQERKAAKAAAEAEEQLKQAQAGDEGAEKAEVKKAEKKPAETKPASAKKVEAKPKKKGKIRQFLADVRSEMKRVTWPTKQDVIRWSGVVVGALIFFGVYVAVLDNLIVTPLLVAISSIGA